MPVQLLGLAAPADNLDAEVDGFLLRAPSPSSTDVANFLKLYSGVTRDEAARRLVARGVNATAVSGALNWLSTTDNWINKFSPSKFWGIASVVSGAASAYHGYKRNNSIGWSIAWFVMGSIFPIVTPIIGIAQGFGVRKGG